MHTFLTVKSKMHMHYSGAYLLNGSKRGNGLSLPAPRWQKRIAAVQCLLFISTPPVSRVKYGDFSTTTETVALLPHDGKDLMLVLKSTYGMNILGYRTNCAPGMKINFKNINKPSNKNFIESFSYPPVNALYEVKDFGVCEHPKQLC